MLIPNDFICSITCVPMQYAVQTKCGHNFNAVELMQWVNDHHSCPSCREVLIAQDISCNFQIN